MMGTVTALRPSISLVLDNANDGIFVVAVNAKSAEIIQRLGPLPSIDAAREFAIANVSRFVGVDWKTFQRRRS
ncbi:MULTISPECIES: hypothetical protein [unclassified Bradyrhizobium]|uniref:hypothetical protein n=1 Tax=unclassified Bradyrhizobium TaxID=2631580 RepID=UPI003399A68A